MKAPYIPIDDSIYEYVLSNTAEESQCCEQIRLATQNLKQAKMLTPRDQVALMVFLIQLLEVQTILELGTFTGYTTLAMAEVLPSSGKIITCDKNKEYTQIAKENWAKSPHADKIELRMGPALDTAQALSNQGFQADLIFIDANKGDYIDYYELSLKMLKPAGLLLVDNTLWAGSVANLEDQENITRKIRAINEHILRDERVNSHLLNIGDGVTLVKHR